MDRSLGIIFLAIGVCFLMLGMNASSTYPAATASSINERVLWYTVSGTISAIVGIYLLAANAR